MKASLRALARILFAGVLIVTTNGQQQQMQQQQQPMGAVVNRTESAVNSRGLLDFGGFFGKTDHISALEGDDFLGDLENKKMDMKEKFDSELKKTFKKLDDSKKKLHSKFDKLKDDKVSKDEYDDDEYYEEEPKGKGKKMHKKPKVHKEDSYDDDEYDEEPKKMKGKGHKMSKKPKIHKDDSYDGDSYDDDSYEHKSSKGGKMHKGGKKEYDSYDDEDSYEKAPKKQYQAKEDHYREEKPKMMYQNNDRQYEKPMYQAPKQQPQQPNYAPQQNYGAPKPAMMMPHPEVNYQRPPQANIQPFMPNYRNSVINNTEPMQNPEMMRTVQQPGEIVSPIAPQNQTIKTRSYPSYQNNFRSEYSPKKTEYDGYEGITGRSYEPTTRDAPKPKPVDAEKSKTETTSQRFYGGYDGPNMGNNGYNGNNNYNGQQPGSYNGAGDYNNGPVGDYFVHGNNNNNNYNGQQPNYGQQAGAGYGQPGPNYGNNGNNYGQQAGANYGQAGAGAGAAYPQAGGANYGQPGAGAAYPQAGGANYGQANAGAAYPQAGGANYGQAGAGAAYPQAGSANYGQAKGYNGNHANLLANTTFVLNAYVSGNNCDPAHTSDPSCGCNIYLSEIRPGLMLVSGLCIGLKPSHFYSLRVHEYGDVLTGCKASGKTLRALSKNYGGNYGGAANTAATSTRVGDFGYIQADIYGMVFISLLSPVGFTISCGTPYFPSVVGRSLSLTEPSTSVSTGLPVTDLELEPVACGVLGFPNAESLKVFSTSSSRMAQANQLKAMKNNNNNQRRASPSFQNASPAKNFKNFPNFPNFP